MYGGQNLKLLRFWRTIPYIIGINTKSRKKNSFVYLRCWFVDLWPLRCMYRQLYAQTIWINRFTDHNSSKRLRYTKLFFFWISVLIHTIWGMFCQNQSNFTFWPRVQTLKWPLTYIRLLKCYFKLTIFYCCLFRLFTYLFNLIKRVYIVMYFRQDLLFVFCFVFVLFLFFVFCFFVYLYQR